MAQRPTQSPNTSPAPRWQQLHLQLPKAKVAACEERLNALGAVSILLDDAHDDPIFEPPLGATPLWREVILTAIFDSAALEPLSDSSNLNNPTDFADLALQLGAEFDAVRTWHTELPDQNWTTAWQAHFTPILCGTINNGGPQDGQEFWIVPKWLDAPNPNAINLFLDVGLAFGTGYHATTRLCLAWLLTQNLTGKTVLDYGCGTGVLAIAAKLLGATTVLAVDIDPQAVLATRQNATLNRIDAHTDNTTNQPSLRAFLPDEFLTYQQTHRPTIHTLCANILAAPLIGFASEFAAILPKGASIVLSGLLQSQTAEVAAAYAPFFTLAAPTSFDAPSDAHWACLSGVRL